MPFWAALWPSRSARLECSTMRSTRFVFPVENRQTWLPVRPPFFAAGFNSLMISWRNSGIMPGFTE